MTITHEPDCLGWYGDGRRDEYDPCRSWCFGCMRCEPCREEDYQLCAECGHVFRTAEDLQIEWIASGAPEGEPIDFLPADEIAVCPICAHDF